MIPVLTPDQKRAIDEAATEPVAVLIERAGSAVARAALDLLGGSYGRTVNVVAGPGNNGADGHVAAARLRELGVVVREFDALDLPSALPSVDLVIDAAFGSGFRDSWSPPEIGDAKVLAVDVPTGLDGATGEAPDSTWRATVTVTFVAASPGHVLGRGPDVTGQLIVADIGLPTDRADTFIVEGDDVAGWLPKRARDAHKWADGVRIVAGSPGMTGAAHLAAASAMRSGASIVAMSSPGIETDAPIEAVDVRIPPFDWADEVLSDLHRFHALVLGPGLGREDYSIPSMVRTITDAVVPVVIDGDGLFALSWNEDGAPTFLTEREVPTVLTPHDGEYGILAGRRPGDDRIAAARHLVELTGATVLLKGPTTVVAAPGEPTWLVTNGTERLATAGTGDVLSGVIGAFVARGVPAARAAAAAAWVHAQAAHHCGPAMIAGDLIDAIPTVLERLT
ncbi:MAG: NAD(P)H-hydrate dehydratase [Ilumatobacter sp.]|nr:NAD(P)H-hydrate dehydratase [Ilumatobacter sp.]